MDLGYQKKILIVGTNGTGKSILLQDLNNIMDRFLLYDQAGRHRNMPMSHHTVHNLNELYSALSQNIFNIRYDAKHLLTREAVKVDYNNLCYYLKCIGIKNIFVLIDEAHEIYEERTKLMPYTEWIDLRGRNEGICIVATTQRPATLHKTLFSQCRHIYVMAETSNYDLTALRKIGYREIFDQVRSLNEFEFVDIVTGDFYEKVPCNEQKSADPRKDLKIPS